MDLTTLARVKTQLGLSESDDDALLSQLITNWSDTFERYLNRKAEQTTHVHTEYPDRYQRSFFVAGVPIVSITSIVQTDASYTIDSDNYSFDADAGIIELLVNPVYRYLLTITYVGGMAANAAAFVSSFPAIAGALDMQVAHVYTHRDHLGGRSFSDSGGSVSFASPTEFLDGVQLVLDEFKLRDG